MGKTICRWHNKYLEDVTEHEMDSCGGKCDNCEDLVIESGKEVDDE